MEHLNFMITHLIIHKPILTNFLAIASGTTGLLSWLNVLVPYVGAINPFIGFFSIIVFALIGWYRLLIIREEYRNKKVQDNLDENNKKLDNAIKQKKLDSYRKL